MFGFGTRGSKKDDSKLSFGLPSLSFNKPIGQATNTLRNTGEKVEKFFFGHHKSKKNHTESKKDDSKLSFGLPSLSFNKPIGQATNTLRNTGEKVEKFFFGHHKSKKNHTESKTDASTLGLGLPSLSLGNVERALGKASNTLGKTEKKVEDFLFGHPEGKAEITTKASETDDSGLDLALPSLSLGNVRGALGKASNALGNTEKKVDDFVFGHPEGNVEINTGASGINNSKLGIGLPSISLGDVRGALGKASNTLGNTEKKVEDFLFGHRDGNIEVSSEASETNNSKLGVGLPSISLGNVSGALGKAANTLGNTEKKVEDFLFRYHEGNVEITTKASETNISELGVGLPSISLGNVRGALGKASNTLENTEKKVEDVLFGHDERNVEVSTEASETNISELGVSLPSISLGNVRGALGKASNALENTEKKVEDFLFGHSERNVEVSTEASETNNSKLGVGLPSISLGNVSLALGKAANTLGNTEKKVEDFLFRYHEGNVEITTKASEGILGLSGNGGASYDVNLGVNKVPILPTEDSITGNLGSLSINDTSLGIHLGYSNVSKAAPLKPWLGASISLPNVSEVGNTANNDLKKVGGAIENTGRKAIDLILEKGEKETKLPQLSLGARNGSLDLNAPSLDVSLNGKGINESDVPYFGQNGKGNVGIDLNKVSPLPNLHVSTKFEKAGKNAPIFSEARKNEPNLNSTSTVHLSVDQGNSKNAPLNGDLGKIEANATSLDVTLGGVPLLPSIHANLPKLSGTEGELKKNLKKAGKPFVDTGKKAKGSILGIENDLSAIPPAKVNTSTKTNTSTADVPLQGKVNPTIPRISLGRKNTIGSAMNEKPSVHDESTPENISKNGDLFTSTFSGIKSSEIESKIKNNPNVPNLRQENKTLSLSEISPIITSTTQPSGMEKYPTLFGSNKGKFRSTSNNTVDAEGQQSNSSNISGGMNGGKLPSQNGITTFDENEKPTTPTEDSIILNHSTNFPLSSRSNEVSVNNASTETIFEEGSGEGIEEGDYARHNITTESERTFKSIEAILRGRFDDNSESRSSTDITLEKEENHVTQATETFVESTKGSSSTDHSTFDYVYSKPATSAETTKSGPTVIPPFILLPNRTTKFGEQFVPVLPPSVFDKPTGKKAPFIPSLPSSTKNPMGTFNLTNRGVNSNPEVSQPSNTSQQSGDLSAVTYGAIGIGAIAIISILLAFIYKAIKKASSSSSGGSYSPESHHKDTSETRKSSSSSVENGEKLALGSDHVSDFPNEHSIVDNAIISETSGGTSSMGKDITCVTSTAPDFENKTTHVMIFETTQKGASTIDTSKTEFTSGFQESRKSDVGTQKFNDSVDIVHEKYIPKKRAPTVNKPPRKIEKVSTSSAKFTSDKTAASNMNEDSLRSLGQALGGILKDQIPEYQQKIKMETTKERKEVKDFGNDSDELISCTPPTTPTDLSDQEIPKIYKQDHMINEKRHELGDIEGEAFFSSGETEQDAGSEYFSADESSDVAKNSNADLKSTNTLPEGQSINSDVRASQQKQYLRLKGVNEDEFVSEDGRKKSIEEDIANSLGDSTHHLNRDQNQSMIKHPNEGNLLDTAVFEVHTRQRGITMCEDLLIDMEVHEILAGKEPYEAPSDESPVEEDNTTDDCSQSNVNSEGTHAPDERDHALSHQTISTLNSSDEIILEDIRLNSLPRNSHLQHILNLGELPTSQNCSELDADIVVNEILRTSNLDSIETPSTYKNASTTENVQCIAEIEAWKMNTSINTNDQSFYGRNDSTGKDDLSRSRERTEAFPITENILEKKLHSLGGMNIDEMEADTTEVTEHAKINHKSELYVERNSIDFVVPKNEPIPNRSKNEATDLKRTVQRQEEQKVAPAQDDAGIITDNFKESQYQEVKKISMDEMKYDITEAIEYAKINQKSELYVQRNLIDFVVPNNEPSLERKVPSQEKQTVAFADDIAEITSKNFRESEYQDINQAFVATPKWYVPFDSTGQELSDPSKGNSDGLYIALSDETSLRIGETTKQRESTCENQSALRDCNMTSGISKKSWTYIAINGEHNSVDEGWPSHLPKNIHENNMSGLGLMKPVNVDSTTVAIQEEKTEAISIEANRVSSEAKTVTTLGGYPDDDKSKLLSDQPEVLNTNSHVVREGINSAIPEFELPNMDKRLMKKRKLRRRQIKSLDSGVHGYYGEYIDLVEFPEFEPDIELTRDEELKMSSTSEEAQSNMSANITRDIQELKIEEDVVTILPDGTIREEKIVIDKISST